MFDPRLRGASSSRGERRLAYTSMLLKALFAIVVVYAIAVVNGFRLLADGGGGWWSRNSFWDSAGLTTKSLIRPLHLGGLSREPGSPPSYRINVFGWRRTAALARLCDGLAGAHYDGQRVSLHLFIDGGASAKVVAFAQAFEWPHGAKELVLRPKSVGLEQNIVSSWPDPGANELGFFFEDDVIVSPDYFRWAVALAEGATTGPDAAEIVGISLATPRVNQFTRRNHHRRTAEERAPEAAVTLPPTDIKEKIKVSAGGWVSQGALIAHSALGGRVVRLQQPASWGTLYYGQHWKRFEGYYRARVAEGFAGASFAVPQSTSDDWSRSWKKYFMEYMYANGYTMLYPNYDDQRALSCTTREKGEHTGGGKGIQEQTSEVLRLDREWLFSPDLFESGETAEVDIGEAALSPLVFDLHFLPRDPTELTRIGTAYIKAVASATGAWSEPAQQALAALSASAGLTASIASWREFEYEPWMGRRVNFRPTATAVVAMRMPPTMWSKDPVIQSNCLRSLESLWPALNVLVVADASSCAFIRQRYYVECMDEKLCGDPAVVKGKPTMNCILKAPQAYAFGGKFSLYTNADIVHSDVLVTQVLPAVHSLGNFVVVGRRWDLGPIADDFDAAHSAKVVTRGAGGDISGVTVDGVATKLHGAYEEDYFMYPRDLPLLERMPPFIIAGVRWDNWLVQTAALDEHVPLIDATAIYPVLHVFQDQDDQGMSCCHAGSTRNCFLAGPHYKKGKITNANLILTSIGAIVPGVERETLVTQVEKDHPKAAIMWEAELVSDFTRIFWQEPRTLAYIQALASPFLAAAAGANATLAHEAMHNMRIQLAKYTKKPNVFSDLRGPFALFPGPFFGDQLQKVADDTEAVVAALQRIAQAKMDGLLIEVAPYHGLSTSAVCTSSVPSAAATAPCVSLLLVEGSTELTSDELKQQVGRFDLVLLMLPWAQWKRGAEVDGEPTMSHVENKELTFHAKGFKDGMKKGQKDQMYVDFTLTRTLEAHQLQCIHLRTGPREHWPEYLLDNFKAPCKQDPSAHKLLTPYGLLLKSYLGPPVALRLLCFKATYATPLGKD